MSWGTVLQAVGVGLSFLSKKKSADDAEDYADDQAAANAAAAKANAKISRYDASVARKNAVALKKRSEEEFVLHIRNIDRIIGAQKVGYASRGVRVGTGTALDVQVRTAYEGGKDAETIIYNGRTASAEANSLSKRYLMLAKSGLRDAAAQSALITSAASSAASNMRWRAVSTYATSVYSIGEKEGWWDK